MLIQAGKKLKGFPFEMVLADMLNLPFRENSFNKVVSVTALEFIEDGKEAVEELFRVTQRGGRIVVATLNSLSPWARAGRLKQGKATPYSKRPFSDLLTSYAPLPLSKEW